MDSVVTAATVSAGTTVGDVKDDEELGVGDAWQPHNMQMMIPPVIFRMMRLMDKTGITED